MSHVGSNTIIYINGITWSELALVFDSAEGARDPLNYFNFAAATSQEGYRLLKGSIFTGNRERLIIASKSGAAATEYIQDLETRLHGLGLTHAAVTSTPANAR